MSFSFGNQSAGTQPFGNTSTNQSSGFGSFGQTPSKPATFGGGFGGTTFTTPPLFGTNPSTFGTGATTGSLFGGQQQQQTSAFGASSAPSGGLFGAQQNQQQTSAIGAAAAPTGGLFGAQQNQQQTPAFGAPQPSFGSTSGGAAPLQTGSLFGNSQPQSTSTFSFGNAQPQSTFSFGNPARPAFGQQSASTAVGGQQAPFGGYGFFGAPQQQQPQVPGGNLFGPPSNQGIPPAPVIDEQAALHQTILGCCKFGDERDVLLADLNYLQASWGTGKGHYSQSNPPVQYNEKNILYRFKSVVYSYMYTETNEDGHVVLHINKPQEKVVEEEANLINAIQTMLAKPNIFFKIVGTKAVNEGKTLAVLTADDRVTFRRILASDLMSALQQPLLKPQLDNLGILAVSAKVKPSPEQLKAYLECPPAGMDPWAWKKAQEANPDPDQMIPIPVLGPEELRNRLEAQKKESQQHTCRLQALSDDISKLYNKGMARNSEITQVKNHLTVTTHRVISVAIKLEMLRKRNQPLNPQEKVLHNQIKDMTKQLKSGTEYRGRLNDVLPTVRMDKMRDKKEPTCSLDDATLEQVKGLLSVQQASVNGLVSSIRTCVSLANNLYEGLQQVREKAVDMQ